MCLASGRGQHVPCYRHTRGSRCVLGRPRTPDWLVGCLSSALGCCRHDAMDAAGLPLGMEAGEGNGHGTYYLLTS